MECNLRECFRALAGQREGAEAFAAHGIHVLSLNVRFQMFNAAFLASPVESEADFKRRLSHADVHFSARGIPWSFWLCDSFLPPSVARHAPRILSRQGLTIATQMPGMIASVLQSPSRCLPECKVRPVDGPNTLLDFREIGARCFRVPANWFAEVFDQRTSERFPFRAWVGYQADGTPVATVATVLTDDSVGVYNLATLSEFRGMGYGEAAMRNTLDNLLAGAGPQARKLPVVLQSTGAGLPLYSQMGFETVTQFRVWVSP